MVGRAVALAKEEHSTINFRRRCRYVAEHASADSQKKLPEKCIPAADEFGANTHNRWSNPDLWSGPAGLRYQIFLMYSVTVG